MKTSTIALAFVTILASASGCEPAVEDEADLERAQAAAASTDAVTYANWMFFQLDPFTFPARYPEEGFHVGGRNALMIYMGELLHAMEGSTTEYKAKWDEFRADNFFTPYATASRANWEHDWETLRQKLFPPLTVIKPPITTIAR